MRGAVASDDNVMRAQVQPMAKRSSATAGDRRAGGSVDAVCYRCGVWGHLAKVCQRRQWCNHCQSSTHRYAACRRRQQRRDDVRRVSEEDGSSNEYTFRVSDCATEAQHRVERTGLMVDTGATSHIITDISKFKRFDDRFQPSTHCMELADGTRCSSVAERRGDAEVVLIDNRGKRHKTTLSQALYIPTYPHLFCPSSNHQRCHCHL